MCSSDRLELGASGKGRWRGGVLIHLKLMVSIALEHRVLIARIGTAADGALERVIVLSSRALGGGWHTLDRGEIELQHVSDVGPVLKGAQLQHHLRAAIAQRYASVVQQ